MKTKALVKTYFQKRIKKLLSCLEKPSDRFTVKDFHAVRVEIKRIKLIFSLLEASRPKWNTKKIKEPFQQIFQLAGKVRELQVQQQMIKRFRRSHLLNRYDASLKNRTTRQRNKFFTLLDKKIKKSLRKNAKEVSRLCAHLKAKSVDRFLRQKHKHIEALLRSSRKASGHVHDLRKEIKQLYMLRQMLHPKNPQLSVTDDFQELLGKWHDETVLIRGLDQFARSPSLTITEKRSLNTLRKKQREWNRQLLHSILHRKLNFL